MQLLHCDKPYNLDEAAARRGAPRRKRKDSRTTAYELTIRIPEEHRRHFGGKKKLTRVVFALNKKVDLKGQVRAFEEEKNAALELALEARGGGSLDAAAWAAMPFGEYAERYVERRSGAISAATVANERRYLEYAKATIGTIPLKELVAEDVERCVLAVPRLSEAWAEERMRRLEENRERLRREGRLKRRTPLSPPRIAGPAMQSKVLKFVREVLNDAVDREHVGRNVAKKRFLSKSFKKGRPLIDPLMEDEAGRFLEEASSLPLSMTKVAVLILFSTGMRPEEMLALRVGAFVPAGEDGDAQVRIVAAQRGGRIENYTKSDSSMRTVPLDRYTASVVEAWIEEKRVDRGEEARARRDGPHPEKLHAPSGRDGQPLELQHVQEEMERVRREGGVRGNEALRPPAHVRHHQPRPGREHQDGVGAPRARRRVLHARPVRRVHPGHHEGAREPLRRRARPETREGRGRRRRKA